MRWQQSIAGCRLQPRPSRKGHPSARLALLKTSLKNLLRRFEGAIKDLSFFASCHKVCFFARCAGPQGLPRCCDEFFVTLIGSDLTLLPASSRAGVARLVTVLPAWQRAARRAKAHQVAAQGAILRRHTGMMSRSWQAWADLRQQGLQRQAKAGAAAEKLQRQLLEASTHCWRGIARRRAAVRRSLQKIHARVCLRRVTAMLTAWHSLAAEMARRRRRLQSLQACISSRRSRATFRAWSVSAQKCCAMKKALQNHLQRSHQTMLQRACSLWRSTARKRRLRRRAFNSLAEKTVSSKKNTVLHAWLEVTQHRQSIREAFQVASTQISEVLPG